MQLNGKKAGLINICGAPTDSLQYWLISKQFKYTADCLIRKIVFDMCSVLTEQIPKL